MPDVVAVTYGVPSSAILEILPLLGFLHQTSISLKFICCPPVISTLSLLNVLLVMEPVNTAPSAVNETFVFLVAVAFE